jgi:hypothetical protein
MCCLTKKRRWAALSTAVLVAALWFARAGLLRGLAGGLIVDQPAAGADCVCLSSAWDGPGPYGCYRLAGELRRKGQPCKVLLIGPAPRRLAEVGAVPSFASLSRSALAAEGIPAEDVSVLRSDGRGDRDFARTLDGWLRAHPRATVLWTCPRFRSAKVRRVLDAVLDPADARRVRVHGLANYRLDETNWWSSRQGLWHFAVAWLLQLDRWAGGDAPPPAKLSAADYERHFLSALKERSR